MERIINPLIVDALRKSTYDGQNEFIKMIVSNKDSIFTSEVLSSGEFKVRSIIEGYWLGFKYPERYSKTGEVLNNTVTYKLDSIEKVSSKKPVLDMSDASIVEILITVKKNIVG